MRFANMVKLNDADMWVELWECPPDEPLFSPLPYHVMCANGTTRPVGNNLYTLCKDVPWAEKFNRRDRHPPAPDNPICRNAALDLFAATWGHRAIPSDACIPWSGLVPEDGQWGLSPWGTWWIACRVPIAQVHVIEAEGGIRYSPSVERYTHWLEEGLLPPPVVVTRHPGGWLQSHNRRRIIAAQEAKVETVPAWLSEDWRL